MSKTEIGLNSCDNVEIPEAKGTLDRNQNTVASARISTVQLSSRKLLAVRFGEDA